MDGRKWAVAHMVWAGLVAAGETAYIAASVMIAGPRPPGQCEGIGFGCDLHGGDLALFLAIFTVPIALAIDVVGHLVLGITYAIARFSEVQRSRVR